MLKWQKSLVDCYGYKNLVKFHAGAADEFSASHAFEMGKLAMMIDGEWRVAFIARSIRPSTTARHRCRSTTRIPSLYGAGYVNGTIIGIPKGVQEQGAGAGRCVKYLTFERHALAKFSNGIRNVPTTRRP